VGPGLGGQQPQQAPRGAVQVALLTMTDPLLATATAAYDAAGDLTSQTDRLGRRRDFTYDPAGRLTNETGYDNTSPVVALDAGGRRRRLLCRRRRLQRRHGV
jgi:YD repeat-containing protein